MNVTSDHSYMKKMNKAVVFETIKKSAPLSRSEISKVTSLNKRTVSVLVNELINEDLVTEIGQGRSSGGRRPVMLLFNKMAGYSIGIDLGVNYILGILTNLEGEIVEEDLVSLQSKSLNHVMGNMKKMIESLINRTPLCTYGVVGIGISMPGSVDNQGRLLFSHNLQWTNINIKEEIASQFKIPTVVYNDAKAGVIGEKRFGLGQEVSNLIYINAGIGIGTGIILNNSLFKGTSGFSGRMGHTVIHANGKKCPCGNKGCWELYASEKALMDQAKSLTKYQKEKSDFQNENFDINTLIQWAQEGDPETINLFNNIGEYLGIGIINIINIFNPEMIIIGNKMSIAEKWLKKPVLRVIEQNAVSYSRKNLAVEFSNLSIYPAALGSSSIAVSNFFTDINISL